MDAWDLLVDRTDLRKTEVRAAPDPTAQPLAPGQALLEVERFAMTANNITYGVIGDAFGYWKFFPAPDGWGRIPAWGFARVVASNTSDAPVGLRLFGYLPMSSHFTADLVKGRGGYVDAAPHRAELPPTYNLYAPAPQDELDDQRALLRPLLMTSFLLDDFLGEEPGLKSIVLSSASSKTGLGLAWFARHRGLHVIGLTSPAAVERIEALGLYDQVVPYDQLDRLEAPAPSAFVDFAGDGKTVAAVHAALGEGLVRSLIVGATHWQARSDGGRATPAGVAPVLFFAPDQVRKRMADWGPGEVESRFQAALQAFVAENPWLTLVQHTGPQGLLDAYHDVLEGRVRPEDGHIIRPA